MEKPTLSTIHFWSMDDFGRNNTHCYLSPPKSVKTDPSCFHNKVIADAISLAGNKEQLAKKIGIYSAVAGHYEKGDPISLSNLLKILDFVSKNKEDYSKENVEARKEGIWLRAGLTGKFLNMKFPIDLLDPKDDYKRFRSLVKIFAYVRFSGSVIRKRLIMLTYFTTAEYSNLIRCLKDIFGTYLLVGKTKYKGKKGIAVSTLLTNYLNNLFDLSYLLNTPDSKLPDFLVNCNELVPEKVSKEVWLTTLRTAVLNFSFPQLTNKERPKLLATQVFGCDFISKTIVSQLKTLLLDLEFLDDHHILISKIPRGSYHLDIYSLFNFDRASELDLLIAEPQKSYLKTARFFLLQMARLRYNILLTITKEQRHTQGILDDLPYDIQHLLYHVYFLLTNRKIKFDPAKFKNKDFFVHQVNSRNLLKVTSGMSRHLRVLTKNGLIQAVDRDYNYGNYYLITEKGKDLLKQKEYHLFNKLSHLTSED